VKLVIAPRKPAIEDSGTIGRLLTVDPGLGGTGWASWNRMDRNRLVPPNNSGVVNTTALEHVRRMQEIAAGLEIVVAQELVFVVVLECPQFMEGGKGIIAARDGDLVSLSILTGFLLASMMRVNRCTGHLVIVSTWKGNMSKEMTAERVAFRLPGYTPRTTTTHEMDAIGLGLFLKGAM
jgi:hypothetical protein